MVFIILAYMHACLVQVQEELKAIALIKENNSE